jgi:hypothetical protein
MKIVLRSAIATIYISSFLVMLPTTTCAQAPEIQWTKTFGNDVGLDWGRSVRQTVDGGYIITGGVESFGAGNDEDVWLIKTNANGDTLWTNTFGSSSIFSERGNSIDITSDSGYVIAGYRHSFDIDLFLIKTNAIGDTLWSKTIGASPFSSEHAKSVQQTLDGGYVISGEIKGNLGLIKCDSNGDTVWTKTYGDSLYDVGNSVQQTTDGGYIITGNRDVWGGNNGGESGSKLWLIKTDANGDTLWTKTFGGSSPARGYSVQQTADNGYIITGSIGSSSIIVLKSFSGTDFGGIWLIKTDPTGDTLWTKIFGVGGDKGYSVQQTTDGGYVITGTVGLIKTDVNGDTSWTIGFEGEGKSVQQTTDSGYIITGNTEGDLLLIKVAPDITSIDETPHVTINDYQLQQNYPNPFNPSTSIEFALPQAEYVKIEVYNTLGQRIKTLLDSKMTSGTHAVDFNASNISSGIYFYSIQAGGFREVKKMVLLQ